MLREKKEEAQIRDFPRHALFWNPGQLTPPSLKYGTAPPGLPSCVFSYLTVPIYLTRKINDKSTVYALQC
jgi:hypothetical protein